MSCPTLALRARLPVVASLLVLVMGCGGSGGGGGGGGGPGTDTPPTVVITAPITGVAAMRGDVVDITFTADDDGAGLVRMIASVDASLATTGDNTLVFGPEVDANGVSVTRGAATAALAPGTYSLFVTVDDGVNPVASAMLAGTFVVMQAHAGVAPSRSTAFGVRGTRVLMSIGETEDTAVPTILNGDMDAGDGVLATLDTATGIFTQHALSTDVTNVNGLGTARKLDNDGPLLFFQVREADQGFMNGDMDSSDTLFGWWYPSTPSVTFHAYGGVRTNGRAFGPKALVTIEEAQQGTAPSLNPPDPDTVDTVGGSIDVTAPPGTRFVIPRAMSSNLLQQLEGSFAAFHVSEVNGNVDLNGDTDQSDNLLLVHNLATNTDVGLAGSIPTAFQGARDTQPAAAFDVSAMGRVVYYVNEVTAGQDFNGDGDMFDNVPSLWNPTVAPFVETFPGATLGMRLEAGNNPRIAAYVGARLFYTSMENRTVGAADDNGNGNQLDLEILRWTHEATPTVSTVLSPNLPGFPSLTGLSLDGGFLAEVGTSFLSVVVQESANGFLDLSGDGIVGTALLLIDASTAVPTVYNPSLSPMASPAPGLIPITGVDGPAGLAVLVSELSNGDLNGDADGTDMLLLYVPFATPTTPVNLGSTAAVDVHLAGAHVGMIANEQTNQTDYNADGDSLDMVFRAFRTNGVQAQPGLTAAPTARVAADDGTLWAFLRSEVSEVRDLNGDGDQLDVVVGVWKP